MKTILKAVCDKAFYSDNRQLNLIGIFDRITAGKFPAVHPFMSAAFTLVREEGKSGDKMEYNYYVDVTDSSGNRIFDNSREQNKLAIGENGKGNLIVNIIGLNFPKDDTYSVNLHIGEFVDSVTFQVDRA